MPTTNLREFLNQNGVPHQVIPHPVAFTATSVAGAAHIKGREMAKTVVVDLDGQHVLAVLPAHRKVDLERLRLATGSYHADLCQEWEFIRDFPGCEPGAMPPFGNLYGLPVYVEPHLAEDEEIAFNAGTHTEVVRMAYKDFERLAQPKLVDM
ncbi:MAG: YbaK/EbsC family protein [Holophagaceae bacterium]|uniref:YbaK/EbsC family protein n=1 Tax=Candidatus Geothrix skivensis TaxID=2954439 RepID=A0A9D7SLL9_9BACT|nr:YbaK/EbsC family protein [Candidatus Geothrix skivensis]